MGRMGFNPISLFNHPFRRVAEGGLSLCPGVSFPGRSLSREVSVWGSLFSQVFVCPWGSRSLSGGICLEVSLQGSLSREVSVHGVSVLGRSLSGGLCPRGVSVQWVSVRETPVL